MDALANLSIAQIRALLKKKEKEEDLRNSAGFKQVVEDAISAVEDVISEAVQGEYAFVDVVRAMAEEAGIAVKGKKSKKGVATGITRASGNRKVNAYMLLLNEERRKLKLTGRKEPKEMTTSRLGKPAKKFLVDVNEGIWTYLKSTGLTSNSAVFQVDYQDWNKARPTENCTPYFAKWWNECKDKKAYNVSTDWETYYKGIDACVVDEEEGEAEVDALIAKTQKGGGKKKKVVAPKKKKVVAPKKKVKAEVLGQTIEVDADQSGGDIVGANGKTYKSLEELDAEEVGEDLNIMGDDEDDEPEGTSSEDGSSDYTE